MAGDRRGLEEIFGFMNFLIGLCLILLFACLLSTISTVTTRLDRIESKLLEEVELPAGE